MTIIKIAPNENGSHSNQIVDGTECGTFRIPEGYAVFKGDISSLENFPFGTVVCDIIDGVPTVTGWTPLPIPEPEPYPEPEPTPEITALYAAATAFVAVATTLTDAQALAVQSLAKTWEQALEEGTRLEYNTILRKDDKLYRVAQEGGVTPQAHQPPDGEGMLAVYRPIDKAHAGTLEDPIPWVYGMDCTTGLYYSYEGVTYLCKGDMAPCVWPPDTRGLWQWETV